MSNDPGSPLDVALDVLVYLPVGVAIAVAEELPKLTEKGRSRVDGRLRAAHMVGRLAVAQGRRLLDQRSGAAGSPRGPQVATPESAPSATAPFSAAPSAAAPSAGRRAAGQRTSGSPPAGSPPAGSPPAGAPAADLRSRAPGTPPASSLAIPGYDSLSASQVVQRLAGLSPEELEQVGRYEAARRGRRTVLARVSQLQHR